MGKPTTVPPTWAYDAAADVDTPPTQQRAIGWIAEDIPPAGWINYLYKWWSSWLDYLQGAYPGFDTLEDAYAGLTAGDAAIVYEADRNSIAGDEHSDGGTAAAAVTAVCATGIDVVFADGGDPKMVARADMDTVVRTFTKTNAGTVQKLVNDGSRLYAAYGNYVEAWNLSTGASVWVYDHGATVWDIAVYDGRLFLGGVSGTGAKEVRSINAEVGGAAQWSYNHNGTVFSVTATHNRVIIAGAASGHASGAHMRALQHATGNDATNEGGTAADTTGVAWNRVMANAISANSLAADARGLWVVDDTANTVIRIDVALGTTVQTSATMTAINANHGIAVDQDYVILGTDDYVYALDRATLGTVWRHYFSGATARCVDSDGCAVYGGFSNVGGDQGVRRIYRGNRPHYFRRITIGGAGAERYQVNPRKIVAE